LSKESRRNIRGRVSGKSQGKIALEVVEWESGQIGGEKVKPERERQTGGMLEEARKTFIRGGGAAAGGLNVKIFWKTKNQSPSGNGTREEE